MLTLVVIQNLAACLTLCQDWRLTVDVIFDYFSSLQEQGCKVKVLIFCTFLSPLNRFLEADLLLTELQAILHMGNIGILPFQLIIAESTLDPNRLSFLNERR